MSISPSLMMIGARRPGATVSRARLVASGMQPGAVYLLSSNKLARFIGRVDASLEFVLVDAHRAVDLPHGAMSLAPAYAAQARLAYSADAWLQRRMAHHAATSRQDAHRARKGGAA